MFNALNRFKSWYVDTYNYSYRKGDVIALTCASIAIIILTLLVAVAIPVFGIALLIYLIVVAMFFAWVFGE
jgi:uncharacterized membrane protein